MVNCSDILQNYSDYRDGLLARDQHIAYEAHLDQCPSCARYDQVVAGGVNALRAVPEFEPSEDFLPRLRHRLYHVEDEIAFRRGVANSARSVGFVALVFASIGIAVWIPQFRAAPATVQLPPVVASAPRTTDPVHTLFRAGPLLSPPIEASEFANRAVNTVFFRYTPLGSYARYESGALRPR